MIAAISRRRLGSAVMSEVGYEVISAADAEERFSVSAEVEYPYADFDDEQEIRLYRGDLRIAGDFSAESDGDWVPYNTIVDGNLIVEGDLTWWDDASGNFLLVTGDLIARNVFLRGCPNVVVRGDLTASGGVQGHHGDDGGLLVVLGRTSAPIVVSTLYFCLTFSGQPDAVLVADPYRTSCPVDFTDDDLDEVVLPDLMDDEGRADEYRIEDALRAGRPILRPTAVPSHRAALAELDRLLADPAAVTDIDLAGARLRAFPEQLFGFPNLRSLSLADNGDIAALPPRIGELTSLRELNLRGMRLTRLPDELCRLPELRRLDLTYNSFEALPERFGDLTALTSLTAWGLDCALPDSVGELARLEELDLRDYAPADAPRAIPFPRMLTRLPRLRSLNLSGIRLAELPDDLLALTTVEELWLGGSLGFIDRLPELAKLPRLRLLDVNGSRANRAPYPDPRLLDAVWPIATLEELAVDRWGEETAYNPETRQHEVVRPALAGLPDDAFAAMPGLRKLDLSFNAFTELPPSFYGLTGLVEVDLRATKLNRSTLDRLGAAFPRVRLDLRDVPATQEVDDPNWREVHRLVSAGGGDGDQLAKLALFGQALALCMPGAAFSAYDQLYALYGTVDAISRLPREQQDTDRLVEAAELALALVPAPGMIWHYTDFGAFQEECTRRVGNALAWTLLQRGELDRALSIVDQSLAASMGVDLDYIRDTKVRILLASGRPDEAFLIVDQVLERDPDFGDFTDLRDDPEFLAWRARSR
jgi:Leucine-rich repeat (LRR) protein